MSSLGARFIWNSRYFHIAKSDEKLSSFAVSGDYIRGLVEYCGTRETVALNFTDTTKNEPSTEKQKELIKELCRMAPNHKNTLEYADYQKAPTVKNASELISVLSEEIMMNGEFNEAANLVEYAATRPGAVKVGTHGLFSFEDDVDLKQAQDEIASHDGNIWTHVLSLRREDADRLGYDNQSSWKALVKSNITTIAKAHNIKLSNLRWYAAMHNTGHHPHIHLFVFSQNPNEGFFSQKGNRNSIGMCKSAFATKIFAGDLENEYTAKTQYREELKSNTKEILDKLTQNPLSEYSEEAKKDLLEKLYKLSKNISSNKEVKYGYLKTELKELVNDIEKQLVYENKLLSELYMKWCEHQFNIEKIYITEPTQVPIEENREFTPIKNSIIETAQKLQNRYSAIESHENIDDVYKSKSFEELQTKEFTEYPQDSNQPEETFNDLWQLSFNKETRDGDVCCKLADCYYYGTGTEKDIVQAMTWYGISADQYKNGIASYRLGNIYESEKNEELAKYYYKQAYYDLKHSIKNWECFDNIENDIDIDEFYKKTPKHDGLKEFLIGKMYYDGKGIAQDYKKALNSFLIASENGFNNANHYLGNMCLNGIGVQKNIPLATEFFTKAAFSGNKHSAFLLYKHYSEENQTVMAKNFLKIASNNGHSLAQVKIADIELENGNIETAIELYNKASENEVADAHYKLGQIFSNETLNANYNPEKATKHFMSAFRLYVSDFDKQPNGYLAYNIAKMYHNGQGTEQNLFEAIKWYTIASNLNGKNYEQEIQSAQQQQSFSMAILSSTVLHIGKVFRNSSLKSSKNRFAPDKKTIAQERSRKIKSGQSQNDSDNYDYNY